MRPSISELAKRLKLSWIREHYDEIEASSNEDYLRILFEKEIEQREERKVNLLLKQATLPKMSGVPFNWKDVVLTPQLTQSYLLEGLFLEKQENLIFYGGVGTGKTYLSSLISLQLIQQRGLSVKFYTVATLVNKLLEAHEKGTLSKVFKQLEKLDLLVLDELGYIPLHKQGAELLFQVISLCYEKTSIIITSNLTFGEWNHVFGDPILTEAVIDRLIHHSHLVVFNGESHRYKESMIHQ
ncbi:ATP-binding protein [Alkalihalobacillus alcalophilus ATCC 27647 = CGMCC 1.3604]|uniref:ATP-binding protein n=2 Tax=Alkalihalobacillus alcalophilus ATCC 27647 = CGMCC 1.3604 TaxID=1218173 RepID=A0A094WLF4_ALKAL|nr:IS21-like element helper ATPase IstB [Alkalihalobacillus alcalophilus]KGA96738.1 ATP-binding protein [Alkalihalobacillus alcalophilus ATCC 27647 = CGMCC 1.3604]MED1563806.1 IS21-like element helper ATPase IstB [Alkalihalobacillus alcalophilus]